MTSKRISRYEISKDGSNLVSSLSSSNESISPSMRNKRKNRSTSRDKALPNFKRPRTIRTRSMSREDEKRFLTSTNSISNNIEEHDRSKCRYCKDGGEMVSDVRAGTMSCSRCGEVIDQRVVSEDADWRLVNNGDTELESSRVGASRNYMIDEFRKRLISKKKRDSSEDEEEESEEGEAVGSTYNPRNDVRSLLRRMERLKKVCELKNLPKKVVDHACQFFAHLSSMSPKETGHDTRVHSMNVLMAASLYTACRFNRVPVTRREICAPFKSANRSTHCAFLLNVLVRDLNLNITSLKSLDFLPRICSALNLTSALGKIAKTICIRISESNEFDMGVSAPATTAASALYVAAHMRNMDAESNVRFEDLVTLLDLKTSSFSRRCSRLIERLDIILKLGDFTNFRRLGLCPSRLARVLNEIKNRKRMLKKSKMTNNSKMKKKMMKKKRKKK